MIRPLAFLFLALSMFVVALATSCTQERQGEPLSPPPTSEGLATLPVTTGGSGSQTTGTSAQDPAEPPAGGEPAGSPLRLHLEYHGDLGATWAPRALQEELLQRATSVLEARDRELRLSGDGISEAWLLLDVFYPNIRVWVSARRMSAERGEAWLWKSSPTLRGCPVHWSHLAVADRPGQGGFDLECQNFSGRTDAFLIPYGATAEQLGLPPVSSGGTEEDPLPPIEGSRITPCEATAVGVTVWHCFWWGVGCGPACALGCGIVMGLLWAYACD